MSLVTAVIPVHNHAHWVAGALRSITSQDHRPLRVVVVDDGSTDGSAGAALAALQNAYEVTCGPEGPRAWLGQLDGVNVLVHRFEQARGPSFARNWGVRLGWDETDYYAFLDSDDLYHKGKISRSVEVFRSDPRIGVVYSDFDTLRPDGLRLRQYKEPYSRRRLLQECLVNCDSLVSKKALEAAGLFDESLRVSEDYDLWVRVTEHLLAYHLAESLVTVRIGTHSSSSQIAKDRWVACHNRVFEKLKERQSGR